MHGLGNRPFDNGFYGIRIHCDAVRGNDETKEAGFSDVEFALLKFGIQLVFLEALENFADVLYVFFEGAVGID